MSSGAIVSIHIARAEGMKAEAQHEIEVKMDFGLVGDYRSGHNRKRQVTLVDEATLQSVEETLGHPVPAGGSRRQVVVRGLDLSTLMDKVIQMGDVVLAVEMECAPCDNMERTIGRGARRELEGRGGLCCRVVKGGVLRVGDGLSVRTEITAQ